MQEFNRESVAVVESRNVSNDSYLLMNQEDLCVRCVK